MLDQFPSVHLSVTSNRQTDRQKIIEGDRADGLTIRHTTNFLGAVAPLGLAMSVSLSVRPSEVTFKIWAVIYCL